jgi:hypothetical protein
VGASTGARARTVAFDVATNSRARIRTIAFGVAT